MLPAPGIDPAMHKGQKHNPLEHAGQTSKISADHSIRIHLNSEWQITVFLAYRLVHRSISIHESIPHSNRDPREGSANQIPAFIKHGLDFIAYSSKNLNVERVIAGLREGNATKSKSSAMRSTHHVKSNPCSLCRSFPRLPKRLNPQTHSPGRYRNQTLSS